METADVAIIGAGPYGLSLAAHLEAARTERLVFGQPLSAWADHMPSGMFLKSEPYASNIASPVAGHALADYCQWAGLPYRGRGQPLPLSTFLAYGTWWAASLVPDVVRSQVRALLRCEEGFCLVADDRPALVARRVVIATGLAPFAYVPPELAALPRELVSHTSGHKDLSLFSGQRVAVVGAGQSALETAALLHEHGAEVEVLTRSPHLVFSGPNPDPGLVLPQLRRPVTPLGEGWRSWAYYNLPWAFRALPSSLRAKKAYESFGPSGAWWLRPRLEGRVRVHTSSRVVEARVVRGRAELVLSNGDRHQRRSYDHVIAGTGYRIELRRLDFLTPALRAAVRCAGGAPVLSRALESSVPGLFFVGATAAPSLGPNMRFLSGTYFTSQRLTRYLARSLRGRASSRGGPGPGGPGVPAAVSLPLEEHPYPLSWQKAPG